MPRLTPATRAQLALRSQHNQRRFGPDWPTNYGFVGEQKNACAVRDASRSRSWPEKSTAWPRDTYSCASTGSPALRTSANRRSPNRKRSAPPARRPVPRQRSPFVHAVCQWKRKCVEEAAVLWHCRSSSRSPPAHPLLRDIFSPERLVRRHGIRRSAQVHSGPPDPPRSSARAQRASPPTVQVPESAAVGQEVQRAVLRPHWFEHGLLL